MGNTKKKKPVKNTTGNKPNIDKNTVIMISVGVLIGIVLTCIVGFIIDFSGYGKLKHGSDVVASIKGRSISATELYEKLKKQSGRQALTEELDKTILDDKYPLSAQEKLSAKEEADGYIAYYAQYGYTQSEFFEENGFTDYDDFLNYITYQVQSRKLFYDFLENKLPEGETSKYYQEHKDEIQTYDSDHILISISETQTDEQALALANEVLAKVNEGKSFDDIKVEYGTRLTYESLGFQGKDSELDEAYWNALVALEDGAYSKELVKTSAGYHIIHKIKTATFEDLRGTILEILSQDYIQKNPNFTYTALDELRKEYDLKIYDELLKNNYDEFLKSKTETTTEETTNVGE